MKGLHHLPRRRVSPGWAGYRHVSGRCPSPTARTPFLMVRSPLSTSSASNPPPPRNSRWLSEIKDRLGKCIKFGLGTEAEMEACRRISQVLGSSWKGLVAGAEGFSVEPAEKGMPEPIWPHRVVWGEMDSMGHVNNVNYMRYAETSRIWYFNRLTNLVPAEHRAEWDQILRPTGVGLILKTSKIEFLLPVQYPDTLSLVHSLGAPSAGDLPSEINFRCWMLSHNHQRVAARVEENVPVYDYASGKKATLPPWLQDLIARTRKHEEESREYWSSVQGNVEAWLQGLEEITVNSGKEELVGTSTTAPPLTTHQGSAEPEAPSFIDTAQAQDGNQDAPAPTDASKPRQTKLWARNKKPTKPTWGVKT